VLSLEVRRTLRLAVDVGGTFTDIVAADDTGTDLCVLKIRSTPTAPEEGLLSAIGRLLSAHNLAASSVGSVAHVSTIGTNLFLGQLGIRVPKTALVTTNGFKDVLEIGRQNRAELYNVFFQRPKPLVPRKLRFEVSERVDSDGRVLKRISHKELRSLARELKEQDVESVAVSFINSYIRPENERDTKRIISEILRIHVFTSSEVDPEHREYERTSTTVVNAVLAPVVSRYLQVAMQRLHDSCINAHLHLLSSSGGLVDVEEAIHKPIVAIESGPAAGVVGAAEMARMLGIGRAISLDMGGTTAKAGCIVDYTPLVTPELNIGGRVHMGRAVKGSGYPVRCPSVDLAEVSAGGGTIVWADGAGSLRIGPTSAGAEPGPACYAAGGKDATITDANLILGRLNSTLLEGELRLNLEFAQQALGRVAEKTGMGLHKLAAASLRLVNLQMARAVDIVSLERGLDVRQFALVAFGGAGPMHAAELAEQVGVSTIVIPPLPGLFSALGMLMTDMKYTYVKGMLKLLDELPEGHLEELFLDMTEKALAQLRARDIDLLSASVTRAVDLRYFGQGYELDVPAPIPFNNSETAENFERKHETAYGYKHEGEPIELTALRLAITVPVTKPSLSCLSHGGAGVQDALLAHRTVWFNEVWVESPVFWRDYIPEGMTVKGPAIIEEYDSTVIVPPGWDCRKSEIGCLVMRRDFT